MRPLTEGETSHPSLLPKVMAGQTWADFHSQLRILANVPVTDHMTKLPGKTFSGLQGSLLSDQGRESESPELGFRTGKMGSTFLCC